MIGQLGYRGVRKKLAPHIALGRILLQWRCVIIRISYFNTVNGIHSERNANA